MSNFGQLRGTGYQVPLIPLPNEPAFVVYSTSANIYLFSHAKTMIGEYGPGTAGSETRASYAWNANVTGQVSSNSPQGYSATTMCGMHGHFNAGIQASLNLSPNSNLGVYTNYSYNSVGGQLNGAFNSRSTGVWANKTRRDNLCLQRFNSMPTAYTGGFATFHSTQIARVGWGAISNPISRSLVLSNPNNSFNASESYGLIGYNETTQQLVVGQYGGTTTDWTLYIYNNVAPPTDQNALDDSWWSSTNIVHGSRQTTTFSAPNATGEAMDYQHWKIIPLDDGNIRIVYKQTTNSLRTFLLTGNSGLSSTSWTKGTEDTITTTTSYHTTARQYFDGLIHLTTYDGKYTICFTQYYYYGAGMQAFIIRHSDGKYFKYSDTSSSVALTNSMIGRSNWLVAKSDNQDGGSGQVLWEFNLQQIYDAGTAQATDISTYYLAGYADSPSSSTSYGGIWQVHSPVPAQIKGVY